MAEYALTPTLGLKRPISGTGQAWSTQKYITDNMDAIEDFASDSNIRFDRLEKYLSGTSAERDAFWGTPTLPADRALLANKGARWYNKDRGYWQQYYAQFDDTGLGTGPGAAAAGWKPHASNGMIALDKFTVGKDGGVGTVTKKGYKAEFAAVATVTLDGLFSAYPEFEEFEILYNCSVASVDLSIIFGLRAAGATNASANYTSTYQENSPAAGAHSGVAAQTTATMNRVAASGGVMSLRIINPMSTTRRKTWRFHSYDNVGYSRIGGGFLNVPGTAFDGFRLYSGAAGSTHTGEIYVYGITKP